MSESDDNPSFWKNILDSLDSPADYACFLAGTVVGVGVDIASSGVSLGQGTVGGGLAALSAKKAIDVATARRRLRRECLQNAIFYTAKGDEERAQRYSELAERIEAVPSMPIRKIQTLLAEIESGG